MYCKKSLNALLAVFFVNISFAEKPNIHIDFLSEAVVSDSIIQLHDIATLENCLEWCDSLANLKVGKPAVFGLTRYVSAYQIYLQHFKTLAKEMDFTANWEARVEVKTFATPIDTNVLDSMIWEIIPDLANAEKGKATWRFDKQPRPIVLPSIVDSIYIVPQNSEVHASSVIPLLLCVKSPNSERKFLFSIVLEQLDSVWVANKKIIRDAPIKKEDFRREYRDVLRLPSSVVRNFSEVEGSQAKQTLLADRVLTVKHAVVPPIVIAGEMVQIKAIQNGIEMVWNAQARQSGRLGEVIQVRELTGNRLVRARVQGKNKLEWVGALTRRNHGVL